MYINFWYPIIRSEDLGPDKPEKIKVLGVNLVAFRDSKGNARVLSDTCVHRGGSLGGPWELGKNPRIVDGCVVCPYHGWEFNGDGECVNIPSIGYGTKPPPRAKVDAYPVQEKYGIVFAFLGDLPESERPPLLAIEEYDDPTWRANSVLVLEVDYYYERSIENGLDPAHNEFVHPTHGFQAINRETYRVREYDVENYPQGWGMWFLHRFNAPGLKGDTWKESQTTAGDLYAGSGTHGPNTMITEINVGNNQKFRQYFFEQPVDQSKTKIFFVNMRNFMLEPKHDGPIHARNKIIAQQDIEILLDVYPPRTPISNTKEVLMPADKAVVAYREWLAKFDDKGWRIDWDEFQRRNMKDAAFAIPSPRRRGTGNWVLETVPLIQSRTERKQQATG
ncbi:MAG: aromatic ring-hydroxylating dioxygenase subunit alpha [Chromatiales bacterium]|jgi:phenylpropionate dioxygenase-like ring-hydroxylating dioxygenase large terminal subunit|nr:aromatic ring-hydroxylating dioxygenase subunit alpha [Chromatiales bacterium]